jgi:hypothetical protein
VSKYLFYALFSIFIRGRTGGGVFIKPDVNPGIGVSSGARLKLVGKLAGFVFRVGNQFLMAQSTTQSKSSRGIWPTMFITVRQ